ncbi:MAG: tetratricopeptide repeat protein, partial [Planctomycetes bacterium]|nr:tetratricopeptide repeat protein [Planctomycetota bacterium]
MILELERRSGEDPLSWDRAACENLCALALALREGALAARTVREAVRRDRAEGALWRARERLEAWSQLTKGRPAAERIEVQRALGEVQGSLGDPSGAAESLAAALNTRSPELGPAARAELHLARTQHLLRIGDAKAAGEAVERAAAAHSRVADEASGPGAETLGWRIRSFGIQVALKGGERARAAELAEQVLSESPPARVRASVQNLRGLALLHLGLLDQAETSFREALESCQALGLAAGVSACLSNLALRADHSGQHEAAVALHLQALDEARRAKLPAAVATAEANLGNLANRRGRLEEANTRYRASLEDALRRGDEEALCLALCALSDVARARGEAASALRQAERAGAFARGLPRCQALVAANRAESLLVLERLGEARKAATLARELRERLGEPARSARTAALQVRIELRAGDLPAAGRAFEVAEGALAEPSASETGREIHPEARAWIEAVRAEFELAKGKFEAAAEAGETAQGLAERSGAIAIASWASSMSWPRTFSIRSPCGSTTPKPILFLMSWSIRDSKN